MTHVTCPTPNKQRFGSRREGMEVLKRGKQGGLRLYRCPAGDHWHITSMTKSQVRERRRLARAEANDVK